MNNVNKTLYIPLYGKAYVSRKGILLKDPKAEAIWAAEGFPLKGKSKSKWLAYYMGMRSAVFDGWLHQQIEKDPDAVVLHIGCGMDSRVLRVGTQGRWYDVDFPEVIRERQKYYQEAADETVTEVAVTEPDSTGREAAVRGSYRMIGADVRDRQWLQQISENGRVIVVMEGISMYMTLEELRGLLQSLCDHFRQVHLLMDCYTTFAAKASKYKNPINDVGVTQVYGLDDPMILEQETGLCYICEHDMTPVELVEQLAGMERTIFEKVFGGSFAKKMYRMYEYENMTEKDGEGR